MQGKSKSHCYKKCFKFKMSNSLINVIYFYAPFLSISRFSPLCVSCNEPIIPDPGSEETVRVVALEKNFHLKCYRCEVRRFVFILSYLHGFTFSKQRIFFLNKNKKFCLCYRIVPAHFPQRQMRMAVTHWTAEFCA